MKRLLYLLLLLPGSLLAQQTSDQGRVTQLSGKYVFYFSIPTAAYDEAFTFTTPAMPACGTVTERANAVLNAALLEAGAQQKPFDAVLVQPGSRDVAIRFKSDVPAEQRAVGRMPRYNGALIFLLAEPLASYKPLNSAAKVTWYDGIVTGNCLATSNVIERQVKKSKSAPGIIISDKTSQAIKFE